MQPKKTENIKPELLIRIDNILLIFFCAVLAGRFHINEAFGPGWKIGGSNLTTYSMGEIPSMLIIAGLIFTGGFLWVAGRVLVRQFQWRSCSLIVGLLLFTLAAIISTAAASNKSDALVGSVNLLSQITLAVILVQLLDTPFKQRLLLTVIVATGVILAYSCWDDAKYKIPSSIEEFNKNPDQHLQNQGIEPGTYSARQYITRIESRDVGGLFSISNTAASFFILSIMATIALISDTVIRTKHKDTPSQQKSVVIILGLLVALCQLGGLWLTKSKGGIGALAAALAMLAVFYLLRKIIIRRWKAFIILALIGAVILTVAVAGHGFHYGRLPSNSMWVRWQYWRATVDMITDHWLCGVGAENYGSYYPRYMDPAAPEVVKDPHCVPLALWSGFGIFAIVAFVWAAVAVAVRLLKPPVKQSQNMSFNEKSGRFSVRYFWINGVIITAAIIVFRRLTSDLAALTISELSSTILIYIIVPAVIWLVVFILLQKSTEFNNEIDSGYPSGVTMLILGCGILGFALHNAIDFAFFHPALGSAFFVVLAVVLAIKNNNCPDQSITMSAGAGKLILLGGGLIVVAYWLGIVVPATKSQANMYRAQTALNRTEMLRRQQDAFPNNIFAGQFMSHLQNAADFAHQAAEDNPFDPACTYYAGRIYVYTALNDGSRKNELLQKAIILFERSLERDPANFCYYQQLADVYRQKDKDDQDQQALEKARKYLEEVLRRHPGKSEHLIEYGEILEELSQYVDAIAAYEKALAIEESFLQMQKQMYPDQSEILPRLLPALRKETESVVARLKADLK